MTAEIARVETFLWWLRECDQVFDQAKQVADRVDFSGAQWRRLLRCVSEIEKILPEIKMISEKINIEPREMAALEITLALIKTGRSDVM